MTTRVGRVLAGLKAKSDPFSRDAAFQIEGLVQMTHRFADGVDCLLDAYRDARRRHDLPAEGACVAQHLEQGLAYLRRELPPRGEVAMNEHRKSLERFEQELGLYLRRKHQTTSGAELRAYGWPAGRGEDRYELDVLVMVYPDGSWAEFLSTGETKVEKVVETVREMAKAARCPSPPRGKP